MSKEPLGLDDAFDQFNRAETNLGKLEDMQHKLLELLKPLFRDPQGYSRWSQAPAGQRYERLAAAYVDIMEALPKLGDFRITSAPPCPGVIAQHSWHLGEFGELVDDLAPDDYIPTPSEELQHWTEEITEYRIRLGRTRRTLVHGPLQAAVREIDRQLSSPGDPKNKRPVPIDWHGIAQTILRVKHLVGRQTPDCEAWSELLRFAEQPDNALTHPFVTKHWRSARGPVEEALYDDLEPVPTTVEDLVLVADASQHVLSVSQLQPSDSRFNPEPELVTADYEEVLTVVARARNTMERLPDTMSRFDEPGIRDLILVILNTRFKGQAMGEVFNGRGKTDILIREQDRNVFIGECKFWDGSSKFQGALNQLLGYQVWRDTKAALLLFIRGGDATKIIEKATAEIQGHTHFVRDGDRADQERHDFILHSDGDSDREILLALIPFVFPPRAQDESP